MKRELLIAACVLAVILMLGITLYPLISNYFSEKNKSLIETQYTEAVSEMDDSELREAIKLAQDYNNTLVSVSGKAFTKEALREAAGSYDALLNIRGDGIMGYIEIPVIGVDLPIYHGTTEDTLDRGVGHLLGSSLPVGGESTHCILTGHSGLAGQKMFSDINKLAKDDVFYLHILGDTLAYKVTEINTVLPEDTSLLGIDAGKDVCTLVTCTPYGVNTHRLLVRGERIEYTEAVALVEDAEYVAVDGSTWTEEYIRGLGYGAAGIAGAGLVYSLIRYLKKPGKRGKHEAAR